MAKSNLKIKIISTLIIIYFTMKKIQWRSIIANYKNIKPCLYAMWHSHQLCLYGMPDKHEISPLISHSNDGEIISDVARYMGITPLRGSQNRGGAKATLQILEALENGRKVALTIDGPKGPKQIVKPGIIKIAQLSQVPIIPIIWYSNSNTWVKLPSWDGFRFPFWFMKSLILYGEPIYVPNELDDNEMEKYRLKLENALNDLYADAQQNYEKYTKK